MLKFSSKLLFLLTAIVFASSCNTSKTAVDTNTKSSAHKNMDEVVVKKYMNTISPEQIKERLYVFASDDFEGRRTGTRGQKRAAEFLSNFYHNNGLEGPNKTQANPYLQPIDFAESMTKGGSMTLGDKKYELNKDYAVLNGIGSNKTSDVVFIGYGIQTEGYNDLEGLDVKDKAVVMIFGEPTTSDGERLFDFSQQESFQEKFFTTLGISNMIVTVPDQMMFNAQFPYMKGSRARISLKQKDQDTAPFSTFFMSPEKVADMFGMSSEEFFQSVQEKVDAKNSSGGMYQASDLAIELDKTDRNTVSHNVMAYIEGTDLKDELIVISSHYDHDGIKNGVIYPGADDDASGTMGVMEIAQAFSQAKQEGHGPRRSILFLNVTGEEEGLLGSQYYTDVAPIFPLANTVANLNIDMIGRVDPKHETDTNYVYIIGSDMLSSELHSVHEEVSKKHFPDMGMDFEYNGKDHPQRFYYRSDHYNFAKNNIPVIFYFNGTHADYHQPTDTPDKINYNILAQRTKLIFATAWELSNMDKKPAVDVILRP